MLPVCGQILLPPLLKFLAITDLFSFPIVVPFPDCHIYIILQLWKILGHSFFLLLLIPSNNFFFSFTLLLLRFQLCMYWTAEYCLIDLGYSILHPYPLSFFLAFSLVISIDLSSNTLFLFSVVLSLLMSPSKTFFISNTVFNF